MSLGIASVRFLSPPTASLEEPMVLWCHGRSNSVEDLILPIYYLPIAKSLGANYLIVTPGS